MAKTKIADKASSPDEPQNEASEIDEAPDEHTSVPPASVGGAPAAVAVAEAADQPSAHKPKKPAHKSSGTDRSVAEVMRFRRKRHARH